MLWCTELIRACSYICYMKTGVCVHWDVGADGRCVLCLIVTWINYYFTHTFTLCSLLPITWIDPLLPSIPPACDAMNPTANCTAGRGTIGYQCASKGNSHLAPRSMKLLVIHPPGGNNSQLQHTWKTIPSQICDPAVVCGLLRGLRVVTLFKQSRLALSAGDVVQ